MVEFKELQGDDLGVYKDENYRLVECFDGHIVFSYAQKGKAMTAHFASDKKGLRHVKQAINEFCDWLFGIYECEVIFGVIKRETPSVMRMVKKLNFNYLTEDNEFYVYARPKWVA